MNTILVVDDSEAARERAGQCLIEHGITPLFAENGIEALEILASRRPDAVLTDLHMPKMDGLRLVEKMRRTYASIPVVLMTDSGNEHAAAAALKAGALSYVPKKDLMTDLCEAMRIVLAAVQARRYRERVRRLLECTESHFVLGYEPDGPSALISHLQSNLSQFNVCDETGLFQVSTALSEAIDNAVEHGNLELDSTLREKSVDDYSRLRQERALVAPYSQRKVYVSERLTPSEVRYAIRDEGPGFDLSRVPDPRNLDNLLKTSGRGLMLIRTFMDEVTFNESGNEITMVKRCEDGF